MPDSLRQWQQRAGRPGNYPSLPATEAERREVLSGLKSVLWAAGPDYVGASLLRLQAHYWRPDFSPAQAAELYADFIEDLSDLPPDILDEACRQYRRNPEAKFFPRPGDLLGIANPILEERRRAAYRLTRSLEPAHPQSQDKHSPEEIARVKAAIASLPPLKPMDGE